MSLRRRMVAESDYGLDNHKPSIFRRLTDQ
jgi:hypothetical protein